MAFSVAFQQHFQAWMQRRTPASRHVKLGQRQIFILPNRYGMSFLALVLLIFVLGTNYQNNLMLGFAFWLVAIFVFSILLTFQNLSGIELRAGASGRDFIGQPIPHHWHIEGKREHYGLRVLTQDEVIFLEKVGPTAIGEITTEVVYTHRGRQPAPRLRVETRFPFGWVTAWTWFQPDQYAIVWPLPLDHQAIPNTDVEGRLETLQQRRQSQSDLDQARPYQSGDTPRRVLWRQYARRGVLLVKTPPPDGLLTQTFSLHQVEHLALEQGLEQLSCWMAEAFEAEQAWALDLGDEFIPLSCGIEHFQHCLSRLALMGDQDDV
ncbi:MAG: DUF58 domain-containing protein [Natronospirillum sp.]